MLQIGNIRGRSAFIFGSRTEQNYIFVALGGFNARLLANVLSAVRGLRIAIAIAGAAGLGGWAGRLQGDSKAALRGRGGGSDTAVAF